MTRSEKESETGVWLSWLHLFWLGDTHFPSCHHPFTVENRSNPWQSVDVNARHWKGIDIMALFDWIFGRKTPKPLQVEAIRPVPDGSYRFIALDVETANSNNGSICQIGLACVNLSGEIITYSTYVNPQTHFSDFNTNLHGIDATTVRHAPIFSEAIASILPLLMRHQLIQHSSFDKRAILAACAEWDLPIPHLQWHDSVQIARKAWPEFRGNGGHGLANLKKVLDLDFQHHDAGEDARAAAMVVIRAEEVTKLKLSDLTQKKTSTKFPAPVKRTANPHGTWQGEIAVFTGSLKMSRAEAADFAASVGIEVKAGVTMKTTILIVGDQDLSVLAGHKKSSKHRRAEDLIAKGKPIQIIGETEFLRLIGKARGR